MKRRRHYALNGRKEETSGCRFRKKKKAGQVRLRKTPVLNILEKGGRHGDRRDIRKKKSVIFQIHSGEKKGKVAYFRRGDGKGKKEKALSIFS